MSGPVALLLLALAASATLSCRGSKAPLGPPDSYLVYEPAGQGGAEPAGAGGSAVGRGLVRAVALDDARAAPIHQAAQVGFLGEMLRTDYLTKDLVRQGWGGKMFSATARARAAEPTVLVLAGSRTARTDEAGLGVGLATSSFFGGREQHADAVWVELGEDPPTDPAFPQTASGRIGLLVAQRLTRAADPATGTATAEAPALVAGYAWAMEVIGREWRVGEGPRGTIPPDAGTGTQRERFAVVRQNTAVLAPGDPHALRPAAEVLTEPGVIATTIYRMAQSRTIGHRVAPAELYAPFVGGRVPPGVSPAAVLGPVRNFQVKLLTAWAGAILAGKPPHDLADLVTAYAAALPAERAEVLRLFVVTTYGVTVKAGGASPRAADAQTTLAELTALSAEVAAGRRSLRQALAAR
jgi:hypothetical protein